MSSDWLTAYAKEIISVVTVFIAFALNHIFRPRARLVYAVGHDFTFLVDQPLLDAAGQQIAPRQTVHTQSIIVRNEGVVSATGVEVTLNWRPFVMNVWPARSYSETESAHSRWTVRFASLAPKESFNIELFSLNTQVPAPTSVRSEECVAVPKHMAIMPVQPPWKIILFLVLSLLGGMTAVYLLITAIQIIARLPA